MSTPTVRQPPGPDPPGQPERVRALDGLRGVAALIVAVYHCLVASSASVWESFSFRGSQVPSAPAGSLRWLFTRTPLHVVWDGQGMVLVFFVLSGYVLARPARRLGRRCFDGSYLRRRFIRLFLPTWAALGFGAILHETHMVAQAGASSWLNSHTTALTLGAGLQNATLLDPGNTWAYTTVIWSLSDEVLFSLLLTGLIVALLLASRLRSSLLAAAVTCLVVAGVLSATSFTASGLLGALESDLKYLPVFVLGALAALCPSLPRPHRRLFPLAAIVAVSVLTSSYVWKGGGVQDVVGVPFGLDVLGAVLVVWVAVAFAGARRGLETRPLQWLGTRSFSLYLVHEPIVVAVAFATRHDTVIDLLVSIPLSLMAADVFWRWVESPSIRLARRAADGVRLRSLREMVAVGPARAS